MNEAATLTRPAPWHNGDNSAMRSQPTPHERFWKNVDSSGDCWLWTATPCKDGYGQFWLGEERRYVKPHRWGYQQYIAAIPQSLQLDHLCRNRLCVRFDHLEIVTPAENVRRGLCGVLKTHCPQGHAYDAENTYLYLGKWRKCRQCTRKRSAEFKLALRNQTRIDALEAKG